MDFWETIEQIEGLSVQTGLNKASGQREEYKSLLKLVNKDIEKYEKNLQKQITIDIHLFRMAVHDIRVALSNIGSDLAARALELENASFKKDTAFCTSNLPAFLEALRSLNSRITEAFAQDGQNNGQEPESPKLPPVFEEDTGASDEETHFDLTILLKLGDVDFRRVLRGNRDMRVSDYINLLRKFDKSTPDVYTLLIRIADGKYNESEIKRLEDIMDLLEDIGCVEVNSAIGEIVKVEKRGHIDYAAECAKKIIDKYHRVQARLLAAKKTGKPKDFAEQLLRDVLPQIELEEETRKLRILAVDDMPVIIKIISAALKNDYQLFGMTDPTQVKDFLKKNTPDLIFLDYEMPQINGFELIPIIRKFEEHKHTPIIFLTAMGTVEHVAAARRLGACDFIVKPFELDNLREKITKHLVRKKIKHPHSVI